MPSNSRGAEGAAGGPRFSEGVWILAGQAAAMLGALVGVRVLTSAVDPATYGEIALALTFATLANQLVLGPIGNAVGRYFAPAVEQNAIDAYSHAVRRITRLGMTVLATAGTVLTVVVALFDPSTALTAVVALAYTLSSGGSAIITAIQSSARQRAVVAIHQGIDPWARFAAAVMIIWFFGASSAAALAGYCLASTAVLISQIVFVRGVLGKGAGVEAARRWDADLVAYATPFSKWGIFTWALMASDRWLIDYYGTTHDVGVYTALFQIGYTPVYLATGMLIQLVSPILFQRAGDASDEERTRAVSSSVRRLTILGIGISLVMFVVGLLTHRQVFRLLVDAEYRSASSLLPWMLLGAGLFSSGQMLSIELLGKMRPQAMSATKIYTAIFGVAANAVGAYLWGTSGVVFGIVLFSVVYVGAIGILCRLEPARR